MLCGSSTGRPFTSRLLGVPGCHKSRLPFDYFIWLDADTVFARNPVDILAPLGHSPIHVPLEVNLLAISDRERKGISCFKLRELFTEAGIQPALVHLPKLKDRNTQVNYPRSPVVGDRCIAWN